MSTCTWLESVVGDAAETLRIVAYSKVSVTRNAPISKTLSHPPFVSYTRKFPAYILPQIIQKSIQKY